LAEVVVVTGGAGYIGVPLCLELAASGRSVRALDVLLHGQTEVTKTLDQAGVELIRGDIRDPAAREAALSGADAVVHLAAIVGDPACARDPELAHEVNVEGTRALVGDAARLGVRRLVFASTCSNYGRMADPTVPIDEEGLLAPVSLYAEQKVAIEKSLLAPRNDGLCPTCLRFATIYGVAPRMRFDLTVNEFTRDLWANRRLEVFGEQFWRPYVHVRDAGRAVRTVLDAPAEQVAGAVFNVGRSGENYRKLDLVEAIRRVTDRGEVVFVHREEDPRDYKVSFDKIRDILGFETEMTVPDGIAEVLDALERTRFGDPFDGHYRNTP
jgi:nucleoside-diphosphate-sugar epimerase